MFGNVLHIPRGVRLITWATAIRFIGWGFADFFLPVFFLSFAKNFTDTGLIRSLYDVVFLLALPIISHFANRTSSKKIILIGLCIYPFISISYFLAGAYGLVAFVLLARVLNGVSYSLDSVGKKTYMRRIDHEHVGRIFGYFDTVSNFWWLTAGVAGLFLINFFPIHVLLLAIIPTTLVAMFLVNKLPKERIPAPKRSRGVFVEVIEDYKEMFSFIRNWNLEQKYIASLYALMGIIVVINTFFIPLVTFVNSQSYVSLFLVTAFAILPYLFGIPLGFLSDKARESDLRIVALVCLFLLASIAFISSVWLVYLVVFLTSLCVYFNMLVLERLATVHEKRVSMGSLSGAFLSIYQVTQILAPICIGFFIDSISLQFALVTVALIGFIAVLPMFVIDLKIFADQK